MLNTMAGNNAILFYEVPKFSDVLERDIPKRYLMQPRLVGYYNYNYEVYTSGTRIKYLKLPLVNSYPIDLNEGFERHTFRKAIMFNRRLELVLQWVMSPDGIKFENECCEKTLVYARGGALAKIMFLPIAPVKDSFNVTILVSRHNGVLYICHTEIDESEVEKTTAMFHHLKLVQTLFSDSVDTAPDTTQPTDANINDVVIHRSTLGNKYDLIYSGEAYGIKSNEEFKDFDDIESLNECEFVMSKQIWMKTNYVIKRLKYVKWWLRAYLANVKSIYLAEKDPNGKVYNLIKNIPVSAMPREYQFVPGTLIGFLYKFLNMIEDVMSNVNSLETVYEFKFNGITRKIHYCAYPGRTEKTFITADFILHRNNC